MRRRSSRSPRAYGLPKTTDAERARKAEVMEAALRRACEPPMAILDRIVEAESLVGELSRALGVASP